MGRLLNTNNRIKRTKRGKGGKREESLKIFSTNAAGLKNKLQSFKNELNHTNAGIFTFQETHFKKKGMLKINGFDIFEAIRDKQKGGTMIGIHHSLNPMLIKEYSDDFELLVVEIQIADHSIRVVSGYGPQETWGEQDRLPFFLALEEEINKAEMQGKDILIQADANSKLGPEIIKGDPHKQTPNGKLLASIMNRHALVVINSDRNKCEGLITRKRVTKESIEESIIDFVITNKNLEKKVESLLIDENRKHILTTITKTKKGLKLKESDHHPLITTLRFTWSKNKKREKVETFNFQNKDCQAKFKLLTTNTNDLTKIFEKNVDLEISTKKFIKRLNGFILEAFQKIRISGNKNNEIEKLLNKRRALKHKNDDESKKELKKLEIEIADKCAKDNRRKIIDEISGIDCNDGGVNSGRLWKLRRKLCPRSRDPPTAMVDDKGNLVTSPSRIEEIALETFKERLKNKPIKDNLEKVKNDKEELCRKRLEKARNVKTQPWTMENLEVVLKYLKKNKSKDPFGYANELFDVEVAGEDLKHAILMLMNRIKSEQVYPKVLEACDITPIFRCDSISTNTLHTGHYVRHRVLIIF